MHDNVPIASIKKLVDYLFDDEQRNFEEAVNRDKDPAAVRDHIFCQVERVAWWLEHVEMD